MAKEKPKKQAKGKGVHSLYDLSSGLKRKNRFCPRCGSGIFMAQHKDRSYCGKCKYTEFVSRI